MSSSVTDRESTQTNACSPLQPSYIDRPLTLMTSLLQACTPISTGATTVLGSATTLESTTRAPWCAGKPDASENTISVFQYLPSPSQTQPDSIERCSSRSSAIASGL
jgi:hypothetical protein